MASKMNSGFMEMMKSKAPAKKTASGGMHKMPDGKMMKDSDMKHGGKVKKMAMGGYADGGMPMVMKDGKKVPSFAADGQGKMKKGGMACSPKKMASGGSASSRADGCAVKGKTKGKMMKSGGKVC